MIDCDLCSGDIGQDLKNPICTDPREDGDLLMCRACFIKEVGREPRDDEQEFDPEDLGPEELAKLDEA